MSDTSEPKHCPKCGMSIPAEAPQGLCPKCVLLQASIPTEGGKGESAPTREEIAAAFPQLEILELIGQGGMGFVFKARTTKTGTSGGTKDIAQVTGGGSGVCRKIFT